MENLNLNLPPFYKGEKVIALINHSMGFFKKGQEFTVMEINKSECCGRWQVDIGKNHGKKYYAVCNGGCNKKPMIYSGVIWFDYTCFASLQERFISFADVIAAESPLIGIN